MASGAATRRRALDPARLAYIGRPQALAVLLLVVVLVAGTAGYVLVEGWSAWTPST